MRLGEYDITSAIDCLGDECADPVVYMGVEEKIAHPGYIDRSRNRQNDIGLVRMDGDVVFTEYIKPLCLPTATESPPSQPNQTYATAGWGRTLTSKI